MSVEDMILFYTIIFRINNMIIDIFQMIVCLLTEKKKWDVSLYIYIS